MIKIKNVILNGTASLSDNTVTITVADVDAVTFNNALMLSKRIEVIDEVGNIVAIYYNRGIQSIESINNSVTAIISVSPMSDSTEKGIIEQIRTLFEEHQTVNIRADLLEDGVLESAGYISETYEKLSEEISHGTTLEDAILDLGCHISTIESRLNTLESKGISENEEVSEDGNAVL